MYEKVSYELKTPHQDALWSEVIEEDTKWCYPKEDKFKKAIRNAYQSNKLKKKEALQLQKHILSSFKMKDKLKQFNDIVTSMGENNEII